MAIKGVRAQCKKEVHKAFNGRMAGFRRCARNAVKDEFCAPRYLACENAHKHTVTQKRELKCKIESVRWYIQYQQMKISNRVEQVLSTTDSIDVFMSLVKQLNRLLNQQENPRKELHDAKH